jgi:UDP-glucose 4-epimerase
MNVLITGGAGFIGSHLSDAMLHAGHTVIVIDELSTGSRHNIAHLTEHKRFQFVYGSVRDLITMTNVISQCEIVIHLAAAVGVQLIVENPVHTIETNIHGTEVVLDVANKFGCKTLLASTSEVYGKNLKIPFSEDGDTTLGPTKYSRWSYACTKMVDEFLALAYHEQYGLPVIVCRLFNTIGPRQTGNYGMVVPRFVRKALRNEPIEIYGTGQQSRCFCNISDVIHALMDIVNCNEAVGEIVNIGANESITIEALANMIIEMTGSKSTKQYLTYEEAYGKPFDDMLVRAPDLSKVKRLIGYEPKKPLAETLQEIIEYERTQFNLE